jgi:hypothetical protein
VKLQFLFSDILFLISLFFLFKYSLNSLNHFSINLLITDTHLISHLLFQPAFSFNLIFIPIIPFFLRHLFMLLQIIHLLYLNILLIFFSLILIFYLLHSILSFFFLKSIFLLIILLFLSHYSLIFYYNSLFLPLKSLSISLSPIKSHITLILFHLLFHLIIIIHKSNENLSNL